MNPMPAALYQYACCQSHSTHQSNMCTLVLRSADLCGWSTADVTTHGMVRWTACRLTAQTVYRGSRQSPLIATVDFCGKLNGFMCFIGETGTEVRTVCVACTSNEPLETKWAHCASH